MEIGSQAGLKLTYVASNDVEALIFLPLPPKWGDNRPGTTHVNKCGFKALRTSQ